MFLDVVLHLTSLPKKTFKQKSHDANLELSTIMYIMSLHGSTYRIFFNEKKKSSCEKHKKKVNCLHLGQRGSARRRQIQQPSSQNSSALKFVKKVLNLGMKKKKTPKNIDFLP